MSWLIGVDVGGTFTDFFAAHADDGRVLYFKRPSTPQNPGEAIVTGLRDMCAELEIDPGTIQRLCHGTTVATNALIQRQGGKIAMITTEGFRDLLEIGRQTRPHMFSLQQDHPDPLVPRNRRFEVTERIDAGGKAITPLDENTVAAALERVGQSGADACAVCGLFSFLNDDHEKRIGEMISARFPHMRISLSSRVRPEFREYERFSTTVLNAYLQPVMGGYLDFLETHLKDVAPTTPVRIYQSSGGLMSVGTAKEFPIRTALSGPAAGVVGAVHTARAADRPNVVTLDMGGTSADVALIRNFDAGVGLDREVAGFPVRLPMIDIHTVGAGGGSIAWFDRDGLLKVGPNSAGADPGPACYGRGGVDPSVTDANLVLGRLSKGGLIGGRMQLDVDAARKSITPLAEQLGISIEKTAQGILGIVVANMVRAVRTISVEQGHDPRAYALMPFGGAGPLHAAEVADDLGMAEIIVPYAPGILCAQGLIASDLKEEFVRSERLRVDDSGASRVLERLGELAEDARAWFEAEGIDAADQRLTVTLDARYTGQNFELPVEFSEDDPGRLPMPADVEAIITGFNNAHERRYGFFSDGEPIEIINIRLTASGRLGGLRQPVGDAASVETPTPVDTRPVWFNGDQSIDTAVYDRAGFAAGMAFSGPAIVEQLDSTTVIFPGDAVVIDSALNLIISVGSHEAGIS